MLRAVAQPLFPADMLDLDIDVRVKLGKGHLGEGEKMYIKASFASPEDYSSSARLNSNSLSPALEYQFPNNKDSSYTTNPPLNYHHAFRCRHRRPRRHGHCSSCILSERG